MKQRQTDEHGTEWITEIYEYDGVPFLSEDSSGTVLVYPAGVDTRLSEEIIAEVPANDPTPERIERVLNEREWVDEGRVLASLTNFLNEGRRYVEARLDPETTAYVAGTPRSPNADEPSHDSAVFKPNGSLFVLSNKGEPETTRQVFDDAAVPLFLGVLFLGFGLVGFII